MIPKPNKNTPVHTHAPPANTPNKVASINNGAINNFVIYNLYEKYKNPNNFYHHRVYNFMYL